MIPKLILCELPTGCSSPGTAPHGSVPRAHPQELLRRRPHRGLHPTGCGSGPGLFLGGIHGLCLLQASATTAPWAPLWPHGEICCSTVVFPSLNPLSQSTPAALGAALAVVGPFGAAATALLMWGTSGHRSQRSRCSFPASQTLPYEPNIMSIKLQLDGNVRSKDGDSCCVRNSHSVHPSRKGISALQNGSCSQVQ